MDCVGVLVACKPFPTIFTPQGDGNDTMYIVAQVVVMVPNSRQYLPRKGTETKAIAAFLSAKSGCV